jgi:hypothetical protein
MRKLKLDIDSLAVQTFKTDEVAEKHGTVQAYDSTSDGPGFCEFDCGSAYHTCQLQLSCAQDC